MVRMCGSPIGKTQQHNNKHMYREFKDVAFEDVVFDHNGLSPHVVVNYIDSFGKTYYYQTPHPQTPHP